MRCKKRKTRRIGGSSQGASVYPLKRQFKTGKGEENRDVRGTAHIKGDSEKGEER